REDTRRWLIDLFASDFPSLQARVTRLENGPPVGFPIQLRVSGEHIDRVRSIARALSDEVRQHPAITNVSLDWDEPSKVIRVSIDQERARVLGVSAAQVATFIRGSLAGNAVSQYREDNQLIEILLRGPEEERERMSLIG